MRAGGEFLVNYGNYWRRFFEDFRERVKWRSVEMSLDAAECAGHVQQLGSESLLPNLMEVKG